MRLSFSSILVLLGMYEVLGDFLPGNSCSCIQGYQQAKSTMMSAPEAFRYFKISPDYLPDPPQDVLQVYFETANVELGHFIEPLRTSDALTVAYPNAKSDVNYTLFLLDLDGPGSNPPNAYVLGINVNIPNSENLLQSGDVAVPLVQGLPTLGTGVHRTTAVLFEQTEPIDADSEEFLKLTRSRVVQMEQFAKTYNLNPEPVAGTFYRTELSRCLV